MATTTLGAAIRRGLAAARGASGLASKAGQLFYATDTKTLSHDDGATWADVANLTTFGTAAGTAAEGNDSRLSDARTPTGGAGGVLSGTYPNPGFAADMATQAELDAVAAAKANTSHTHTASAVTDFAEAVDDRVGALLVEGTGIDLTYNDGAGTLTIAATGGGGGGGHVILDDGGDPLPQEADLQIVVGASGATLTDDGGNGRTVLDLSGITGGGGGGGGSLPAVAPGDIFYVIGQTVADIVLGKTVTDSYHSGSEGGNNLADGNPSSYWSTVGGTPPATASFDGGDLVECDSFALLQYSAAQYMAATVKMMGSVDNVNWDDIPGSAVAPAQSAVLQTFIFDAPVTYRYWRLHVLTDYGTPSGGVGLRQWSVYSTLGLHVVRLAAPTAAGKVLTSTLVGSDYLPRWV